MAPREEKLNPLIYDQCLTCTRVEMCRKSQFMKPSSAGHQLSRSPVFMSTQLTSCHAR